MVQAQTMDESLVQLTEKQRIKGSKEMLSVVEDRPPGCSAPSALIPPATSQGSEASKPRTATATRHVQAEVRAEESKHGASRYQVCSNAFKGLVDAH